MKAAGTLYSSMACPYAHRAMLTIELRPVKSLHHDRTSTTTTNQFTIADKLGLDCGDALGMLGMHAGKTVAEMRERKEAFKRDVNPTGEVPSLLLASGSVVAESEIVCEYIDAVSDATTPRLVPAEPLAAARVRMAMKQFNAVPGTLVALLKNQDESRDAALVAASDAAVAKFVRTLDADAIFCFAGGTCTLADVHAAPFVYRFATVLAHYRGYCLFTRHPRLRRLLAAMEALPAWSAVLEPPDAAYPPVTERSLLGLYAAYAHSNQWAEDADGDAAAGPRLAGRGASSSAACTGEDERAEEQPQQAPSPKRQRVVAA